MSLKFSWGNIRRRLLGVLGGPPRRYWPWFLFFSAVLFLGTVAFSTFLFLTLSSGPVSQILDLEKTLTVKINLSGLEETVKTLENREAGFNQALLDPLAKDPSL